MKQIGDTEIIDILEAFSKGDTYSAVAQAYNNLGYRTKTGKMLCQSGISAIMLKAGFRVVAPYKKKKKKKKLTANKNFTYVPSDSIQARANVATNVTNTKDLVSDIVGLNIPLKLKVSLLKEVTNQ